MLQKCVYSVLTDENVEEELQFLREMKNLLDQIRVKSNLQHLEVIGVINEIYRMAVDMRLEELLSPKDDKIVIENDVLALFETEGDIFEPSRDENEEEDQEVEEEQVDSSEGEEPASEFEEAEEAEKDEEEDEVDQGQQFGPVDEQ